MPRAVHFRILQTRVPKLNRTEKEFEVASNYFVTSFVRNQLASEVEFLFCRFSIGFASQYDSYSTRLYIGVHRGSDSRSHESMWQQQKAKQRVMTTLWRRLFNRSSIFIYF